MEIEWVLATSTEKEGNASEDSPGEGGAEDLTKALVTREGGNSTPASGEERDGTTARLAGLVGRGEVLIGGKERSNFDKRTNARSGRQDQGPRKEAANAAGRAARADCSGDPPW